MTSHDHSNAAPVDLEPLCSEEEFAQEVRELVADEAPQVFALVEEYGERVDGRIVAWGMAFDDRAEVVSVNGGLHMSLASPERAHRAFSRRRKIRLVRTSHGSGREQQGQAADRVADHEDHQGELADDGVSPGEQRDRAIMGADDRENVPHDDSDYLDKSDTGSRDQTVVDGAGNFRTGTHRMGEQDDGLLSLK
ncbi:MAG: hypothetical protein ACRDTT_18965, partial [Pseudonocardiaceae bacterium]